MSRVLDLRGQRFGRWTVLGPGATRYWLCKCDCGTLKEVFVGNLRPKLKTNSCGCWGWSKEVRAAKARKHGCHGTGTYSSWQAMKARVGTREEYKHISIDPAWEQFEQFLLDMGPKPEGYSLERIDNLGNYCKSNCCWIPRGDQAKNTRRQIWFTHGNKSMILSDWCKDRDMPYDRVRARISRGWPIAQALELEPRTPSVRDRH